MSYIGSTPTTQSFIAGTDYFNGTGAQVAFTLSRSVNSVNDIEVVVNNVEQSPASYTASGTTLTFSAAPSSGTGNIYVRYLSTTLQSIAPSQGSVSPDKLTTGALYWDASGNIGIGTSSLESGFKLNIAGNAFVQNVAGQIIGKIVVDTSDNRLVLGSYFEPSVDQYSFISSTNNAETANIPLAFRTGTTERMRLDSAGNLKFNSGYGSVATAYGCRAWVNFNGTGTVAIRASGNVSSITDNGVGNYRVNFATAMPDANFAVTFTVKGIPATVAGLSSENHDGSRTASYVDVLAVRRDTGAGYDSDQCNAAIFR